MPLRRLLPNGEGTPLSHTVPHYNLCVSVLPPSAPDLPHTPLNQHPGPPIIIIFDDVKSASASAGWSVRLKDRDAAVEQLMAPE